MIVLDKDGSVVSVTDQARFWLEQFPRDCGTGLQLPVAVHAVARRAVAQARSGTAYASVRLISGKWLTVHAARCTPTARTQPRSRSCSPRPHPPSWSRCDWRCAA